MNAFRLSSLILYVLFTSYSRPIYAQARPEPADTIEYRIRTDDNNLYQGIITERNSDYVVMETKSVGRITIPFVRIAVMEKITTENRAPSAGVTPGVNFYARPQETSYQFMPNGYGLEKGEGYYQNYYLFINQIYVGVTDYFTIGGGLSPLPIEGMPAWVTPKFSFPLVKNKVNIGLGSLNGIVMGESMGFGVFYGSLTIGSRKRNFSIGVGKGYLDGTAGSLALSINGIIDIGERAYLSTENYVVDGISMGTVGGRHIWPNISIDYGLLYRVEFDTFFAVPMAGIMVPFGHKN